MLLMSSAILVGALQGQAAQAQVHIRPAEVRLAVDAERQLRVDVTDSLGRRMAPGSVRWFSLNTEIVSVDSTGIVRALRPGAARIAAHVGDAPMAMATVTVPELPPARLELGADGGTRIRVGSSAALRVAPITRLGDTVDVPVTYRSERPEVASVDMGGRVYARRSGRAVLVAAAGGIEARLEADVVPNPAVEYNIGPEIGIIRTGDVARLSVIGRSVDGMAVSGFRPEWSVAGSGATIESDGVEGVFVAEQPGSHRVVALIGAEAMASTVIRVEPRTSPGEVVLIGRGPVSRHHSGDMWAFEGVDGRDYVYLGTYMHDWLKVFDVTDPANPVLTDSVQMDARRINDVKIHANNRIAIATREGASSRLNGIVILDLSTPAHPSVLSEYSETVTGGVHNVWILSEHDVVYAAHNGTSDIHIIDISAPSAPREVGRWGLDKQRKVLHDVYVHEGYAYLSYWNDGLVMLDAGAGTHGGTAQAPTLVSQFKYPIPGNTHTAWRHGRYLFVGDEIYPSDWDGDADRRIDARGYIHVLDYADPEKPIEVARYEVPEAGAHNLWAEDDLLYVGYYQGGLRVVDISGELRGDLYHQGREIGMLLTTDENTTVPNWPMTWGAQVFKGNIFSSDLHSGLWVTKYQREPLTP
ncbi:MAG: hypothetical protein HKM89_14435 [Gemmatimonadales bacterium]|nr:hypothetical protein [Gemmatimonadales bacterium]